jgi:ABC-type transport system involved in cytochrome c biogenesis ATPase subunit
MIDTMKKRGPGRPPTGERTMERFNVILDLLSLKRARELGNGNLSAGIRKALALALPRLRR